MNRRVGAGVGSYFWPRTRIRRRAMAARQHIKMRGLLKTMAVYVVISFAFCLGYVWTRVQVVETGYRLRHLEEIQSRLKEENRSLLVEAATLRSPQRIERMAPQLGLKRPNENQIVYLKKQATVGEKSP